MNTDSATTMRRSRLARARTIRRRVIGGAVALFVATWLLIAVVLVSGHDPALAAHGTTTTSSAAATTTTAGAGSGSGSSPAVTTSSSGSANSAGSGTTSAAAAPSAGSSLGSVSTRAS